MPIVLQGSPKVGIRREEDGVIGAEGRGSSRTTKSVTYVRLLR